MASVIKEEKIQNIVTDLFVRKMPQEEIARRWETSRQSVSNIKVLVDGFYSGNYGGIIEKMRSKVNMTDTFIRAVFEYLGVETPAEIVLEMQRRAEEEKEAKKKKAYELAMIEDPPFPAEETKEGKLPQSATPTAPSGSEPTADEANQKVFFIRILEELHEQNELMRQLLDVVIPHYVADLKDSLNANADVIGQDLRGCLEELKGIRCNTRKRGL